MTAEELNAAIQEVYNLPRVRFDAGLGEIADNWIYRKHADGAVHEPATLGAFLACRKHRDCHSIYDAGALYGYFTLFASMLWGDKAELTAIEMHPGVFDRLCPNVGHWAMCVNAALSDKCSREKVWLSGFNIYEEPKGGWQNLPNVPGAMKERGDNNRGRGFHVVDFITLDAYCKDNLPPDLLKVDVEAYQAKAIQGALGTIAAQRPVIVIELHDAEKVARLGTTNAATVKPLFDLGYTAFWCGNFRDRDARFEQVAEMRPEHERLSLMVFA